MHYSPGTYIDHYRIETRIGEGGMGTVYKIFDTKLGRYAALKVIRTEKLTEKNAELYLKNFGREAKSMGSLDHPNIAHIDTYGEFDGQPYFVMELLSSYTLQKLMATPMTPEKAAELLLPIMDAVIYAHSRNILHRDLKPSNILFRGNAPVLTDFGLAKFMKSQYSAVWRDASFFGGTPQYMSPEQAMGLPLDGRSDEFALAVILYEMITGFRPFGTASVSKNGVVINKILRPDLTKLPIGLRPILGTALARDPENRYDKVKNFADALRTYVAGRSGEDVYSSEPDDSIETLVINPQQEHPQKEIVVDSFPAGGFSSQEKSGGKRRFWNLFRNLIAVLFLCAVAYFVIDSAIYQRLIPFMEKTDLMPEENPDVADVIEELPLNNLVQSSLDRNMSEKVYNMQLPDDSKVQLSNWSVENPSTVDSLNVSVCLEFDNAETCLYELTVNDAAKPPFFLPAGEYHLILKAGTAKPVKYEMLWSAESAPNIERERNDDKEHALPIVPGTEYTGSLWTIDDVDYYEINMEMSGTISLNFWSSGKENGETALFEGYLYGAKSPYRMLIGAGVPQKQEWKVDEGVYYLMIQNVLMSGERTQDNPFNTLVPYRFEFEKLFSGSEN